MRFTSLVIELIRARPWLVFWLVVLLQALLWLVVPVLLYRAPPNDLALVLAYGREFQVGTEFGPPLAFWLADIAYRAVGNHMFGVYLLAQLCAVVMFWALYQLGRALVGGPHSVLAVLLTMTVTVFSSPGVEFGPLVLARPLWALLLLHSWQLIGQGRRKAWFAWSIEAGLLLLTISSAVWLLLLIAGFAVATPRGRRMLRSLDPLFALSVIVVLALPYLVWLIRAHALGLPQGPTMADLSARTLHWATLFGDLVFATAGILLLLVANFPWFMRKTGDAPVIDRPPLNPLARDFAYFFAIAPALGGSIISGLFNLDQVTGGAGVALSMSGLAIIVGAGDLVHLRRQRVLRSIWALVLIAPALVVMGKVILSPWIGIELQTSQPARAIASFFGDSFERRTNRTLPAVAGDISLASLISLGPGRPHLLIDATPQRTPWLTVSKFDETGGVVVWRASNTAGTPPPEIAQRFPGLVPEVPRAFEWLVNGRQPLLRIGWAIVRPKTP